MKQKQIYNIGTIKKRLKAIQERKISTKEYKSKR